MITISLLATLVLIVAIAAKLASRWEKTVRLDTATGKQTVVVGFRSTRRRRPRRTARRRTTTRRR